MPPRHAYWTILIDDKPTAFRAREREELQPTFVQLQRKNANAVMRWFARGKLWASREAERDDFQMQRHAASAPREPRADRDADKPERNERRGSDWRPGGAHKDPRDRFKKKNRPERAWSEKDPATQRDRDKPGYAASRPRQPRADRPSADRTSFAPKPSGTPWQDKPRADRPPDHRRPPGPRPSGSGWSNKPPSSGGWRDKPSGGGWSGKPGPRDRKPWNNAPPVPNDRPWQTKPTGPRAQRKPWVGKPSGNAPGGDRPWREKPAGGPPRGDRPRGAKPFGEQRPWTGKPPGPPRGDRPPDHRGSPDRRPDGGGWSSKPPGSGDRKPWQKAPFRPGGPPRQDARGGRPAPRKRRDDEPPDRDS